jgi:hypothetical protein
MLKWEMTVVCTVSSMKVADERIFGLLKKGLGKVPSIGPFLPGLLFHIPYIGHVGGEFMHIKHH